jgi:hypothetical protein
MGAKAFGDCAINILPTVWWAFLIFIMRQGIDGA